MTLPSTSRLGPRKYFVLRRIDVGMCVYSSRSGETPVYRFFLLRTNLVWEQSGPLRASTCNIHLACEPFIVRLLTIEGYKVCGACSCLIVRLSQPGMVPCARDFTRTSDVPEVPHTRDLIKAPIDASPAALSIQIPSPLPWGSDPWLRGVDHIWYTTVIS